MYAARFVRVNELLAARTVAIVTLFALVAQFLVFGRLGLNLLHLEKRESAMEVKQKQKKEGEQGEEGEEEEEEFDANKHSGLFSLAGGIVMLVLCFLASYWADYVGLKWRDVLLLVDFTPMLTSLFMAFYASKVSTRGLHQHLGTVFVLLTGLAVGKMGSHISHFLCSHPSMLRLCSTQLPFFDLLPHKISPSHILSFILASIPLLLSSRLWLRHVADLRNVPYLWRLFGLLLLASSAFQNELFGLQVVQVSLGHFLSWLSFFSFLIVGMRLAVANSFLYKFILTSTAGSFVFVSVASHFWPPLSLVSVDLLAIFCFLFQISHYCHSRTSLFHLF